jgi:hypothetical protein
MQPTFAMTFAGFVFATYADLDVFFKPVHRRKQ